ncbi:UNVERIFIED_CONTAM: hypothetical protein NCL1_42885 [Trichonephila clavipes]
MAQSRIHEAPAIASSILDRGSLPVVSKYVNNLFIFILKCFRFDNRTIRVSNQKPRLRFQRRSNLQGLIRVMVGQQRTMLDRLDKLFHSLEASNTKLITLMESLVNKVEISTDSQTDEKLSV